MVMSEACSNSLESGFSIHNDHTYCERESQLSKRASFDSILDVAWDTLEIEHFDVYGVQDQDGFEFEAFHSDFFDLDEFEDIGLDNISSCDKDLKHNTSDLKTGMTDREGTVVNQANIPGNPWGNDDFGDGESLEMYELPNDFDNDIHSIEPTFLPISNATLEMYSNIFAQIETEIPDQYITFETETDLKSQDFDQIKLFSDMNASSFMDGFDDFDVDFERYNSFETDPFLNGNSEDFTSLDIFTDYDYLLTPTQDFSEMNNSNELNARNADFLFNDPKGFIVSHLSTKSMEGCLISAENISSFENGCDQQEDEFQSERHLYNTMQIAVNNSQNWNNILEKDLNLVTGEHSSQPDDVFEQRITPDFHNTNVDIQNIYDCANLLGSLSPHISSATGMIGGQKTTELETHRSREEMMEHALTPLAHKYRERTPKLKEGGVGYSSMCSRICKENFTNEVLQENYTRCCSVGSEDKGLHDPYNFQLVPELVPNHKVCEWELQTKQSVVGTFYANSVNEIDSKSSQNNGTVPLLNCNLVDTWGHPTIDSRNLISSDDAIFSVPNMLSCPNKSDTRMEMQFDQTQQSQFCFDDTIPVNDHGINQQSQTISDTFCVDEDATNQSSLMCDMSSKENNIVSQEAMFEEDLQLQERNISPHLSRHSTAPSGKRVIELPQTQQSSASTLLSPNLNDSSANALLSGCQNSLIRPHVTKGSGEPNTRVIEKVNFQGLAMTNAENYRAKQMKTVDSQNIVFNSVNSHNQVPNIVIHNSEPVDFDSAVVGNILASPGNWTKRSEIAGNTCLGNKSVTVLNNVFAKEPTIFCSYLTNGSKPVNFVQNDNEGVSIQSDENNAASVITKDSPADICNDKKMLNYTRHASVNEVHFASNNSINESSGDGFPKNSTLESSGKSGAGSSTILNCVENVTLEGPEENTSTKVGKSNNVVQHGDSAMNNCLLKMGLAAKNSRNKPNKMSEFKMNNSINKFQSRLKQQDTDKRRSPQISVGVENLFVSMKVSDLLNKNVKDLKDCFKKGSQKTAKEIQREWQNNVYLVRQNKFKRLKAERQRLTTSSLQNPNHLAVSYL